MALWDAGIWDTAKWSTIEATASITLDDISFSATGKDVHTGTLALTLDDVSASLTGKIVHSGALSLTLDDIVFSDSGTVTHNGTLALTLDDITILATGQDVHAGTLAITLDNITFNATGGKINSGILALTLDDILFSAAGSDNPPISIQQTRGGYKSKKQEYKKTTQEIENVVSQAIDKVIGVDEKPIVEIKEIEQPQYNFADEYHYQLEQQAKLLNLTIEQYLIDLENDDEEAILMLL